MINKQIADCNVFLMHMMVFTLIEEHQETLLAYDHRRGIFTVEVGVLNPFNIGLLVMFVHKCHRSIPIRIHILRPMSS